MESAGIKPGKKDSNVLGALCYFSALLSYLGLVVPLLIYLTQKDDKFARYHALQAIFFYAAVSVVFMVELVFALLLFITIIGYIAMIFVMIATGFLIFLFNLYMAYNAYQGESLMLPYLGEKVKEHL